jgi:hypothetical protein
MAELRRRIDESTLTLESPREAWVATLSGWLAGAPEADG